MIIGVMTIFGDKYKLKGYQAARTTIYMRTLKCVGMEVFCHPPLFSLLIIRHFEYAACIEPFGILRVRVGDRHTLQSHSKLVISGGLLLFLHEPGEGHAIFVLFAHDLQCQYPLFQDLELPLEVKFYELKALARIALEIFIGKETVE
jgi:hypothetical protein